MNSYLNQPKVQINLREVVIKNLAVQWLGLHTSTAGGTHLIPGRGTNIPHAHGHKKKKKMPLGEENNCSLLENALIVNSRYITI